MKERAFMSKTKPFSVKTNREDFIAWLCGQVAVVGGAPRQYKDGYLSLDVLIAPAVDEKDYTLMRIDGLYDYVNDTGRNAHKRLESLFTFEVNGQQEETDTEQIEVRARCTTSLGQNYYQRILGRIGKRWPESGLTTTGTERRPVGASRKETNDWAYEQVVVKKRPYKEVLPEWKAKRGTANDYKLDTLSDLKKAVQYRIDNPLPSLDE